MQETPARSSETTRHAPGRPKRFRFDEGSGSGTDLAPGRGSLLRAFRAWGGDAAAAKAAERRSEIRHHHVECLAWIGWKKWRGFVMNDALLVNLSRCGAQIFIDTPPPRDRPVWVFLETPGRNAIVKARVLEVRTTVQGQCVLRVEFREPCPYSFFEAAVCGLTPSDPKHRMAPAPRVKAAAPARMVAG